VRFVFADSIDQIDPGFNFESDEYSAGRQPQNDDVYAHEFFPVAPYDGILVSRAIVGDRGDKGKYTTAQSIRFRREGAARFLRYNAGGMLLGDCGAFSYVNLPAPPYETDEIVDYYGECGFTHAVSVDHVILGYGELFDEPGALVSNEWAERYNMTLRLAERFLVRCAAVEAPFMPIGVVQGWSPRTYAKAARQLAAFGYDYLALGGMAQLKIPQLHRVLREVRDAVPDVRLHVFGFAKVDHIEDFLPYRIESFDSTSPLLRSFKDGKRNYFHGDRWYTAIRIPHADDSLRFKNEILAGRKDQQTLRRLEQRALQSVRSCAQGQTSVKDAVREVAAYATEFRPHPAPPLDAYREALTDRPWDRCLCRVCKEIGVEVMLYRGSNRHRRRGYHNMWTFHRKLRSLREVPPRAV